MAYRPPHLRAQPSPHNAQSTPQQPVGNSQHASSNGARREIGNSSQSRSTPPPSRSNIQSTDQMKPSRLAEMKLDPMELIQSVSRSGGDGAEGDAYVYGILGTLEDAHPRLKGFEMQDRYRVYIDGRVSQSLTFKNEEGANMARLISTIPPSKGPGTQRLHRVSKTS